MRLNAIILILLFFITACSNQSETSTITEEEIPLKTINSKPELVETEKQHVDSADTEFFLRFNHLNEKVSINLDKISILKAYLSNVKNRQKEADNMKLIPIQIPNNENLSLLEFSCHNNNCSYLLLDLVEEGHSHLIADIAQFERTIVSPDQTTVLIIFYRSKQLSGKWIHTQKVVAMDLEDWEVLPIQQTTNETLGEFEWPIHEIEWIDNKTVRVTLPNIEVPSKEALLKWENSDKQYRTVKMKMITNE